DRAAGHRRRIRSVGARTAGVGGLPGAPDRAHRLRGALADGRVSGIRLVRGPHQAPDSRRGVDSAGLLTLYDHPISSNALKVRFLLAELGLDYERRQVPIERPRPEWYAEVNPLIGIPSLQD